MKKLKGIIVSSLALLLSSCSFFNPTNNNNSKDGDSGEPKEIILADKLEDFEYKTDFDNDIIITGLKKTNANTIVIPENVYSIESCNGSAIYSLTINDGIHLISEGAFNQCISLAILKTPFVGHQLSGGISSLGYFFAGAENSSDNIKHFKTINEKNGKRLYCPASLKEISVTKSEIIYGDAFTGLEKANVKTINIDNKLECLNYYGFRYCRGVDVNIISTIEEFFNLEPTYTLEYMSDMPNFHLIDRNGEEIKGRIRVSDTTTYLADYNLYYFKEFKEIILPATVVHVGEYAFPLGSKLLFEHSVGQYHETFSKISLSLNSNFTFFEEMVNYRKGFINQSGQIITDLIISDGITEILKYEFSKFEDVKYVYIPDSVMKMESGSFYSNDSIETIRIPYCAFTVASGTEYEYTSGRFTYLFGSSLPASLNKVIIGDNCKEIPFSAFKDCGIKEVVIGSSVTLIGENAFEGCDLNNGLTFNGDIPDLSYAFGTNIDVTTLNGYDHAYYLGTKDNPYFMLYKAKDTTITDIRIHEDCKVIYNFAFSGCRALSEIDLPKDLGSLCFYSITLQNVNFRGSLEQWFNIKNKIYLSDRLGEITPSVHLYLNGSEQETKIVTIPNTVTFLDAYTFNCCKSIEGIVLPTSVTRLDVDVFNNCDKLTAVYYQGTQEELVAAGISSSIEKTIYFYSETEPAETGNYWHYVNNVPVVW